MRELITEALDKLQEKVLLLRTFESIVHREDRRKEDLVRIEERVNETKIHIEEIRQAIIEYALHAASQTHHSNLEGAIDGDVSFAQVQVNKG